MTSGSGCLNFRRSSVLGRSFLAGLDEGGDGRYVAVLDEKKNPSS